MLLMTKGWVVPWKDLRPLGERSWKHVSGINSGSGGLDHSQEGFLLWTGLPVKQETRRVGQNKEIATVRV